MSVVEVNPWVLASLPIIGLLLGAGLNELRSVAQHRREHADWLRERRFDAYVNAANLATSVELSATQLLRLIADGNDLVERLPNADEKDRPGMQNAISEISRKLTDVQESHARALERAAEVSMPFQILGPDELDNAMGELAKTFMQKDPNLTAEAKREFIRIARKTLKIPTA